MKEQFESGYRFYFPVFRSRKMFLYLTQDSHKWTMLRTRQKPP